MDVLLTGATGYIGQSVASALARAGHRVRALARTDESAARLRAAGHDAVRGDMREPAAVAEAASRADAVIHASTTNGPDMATLDPALTRAILQALRGTEKPFVYTSGVWSVGPTGERPVDEDAPTTPLPTVAWRAEVEREVLRGARRGVVLRPGIVHGRGGGIPGSFVQEARERGRVRVVGDGRQEWPMVHVDDLGDLYVRALDAPAGSLLHGTDSQLAVRELALAASVAGGAPGKLAPWDIEDARREVGGYADALAMHQRVSSEKTRRLTGWAPWRPSVVEEMLLGSYARAA